MRWTKKPEYELYEIRIKRWFALLPVECKGEVRWLEFVTVKQNAFGCKVSGALDWLNLEFIDTQKEG